MGYEAVKVFWVEPTGRWRAHYRPKVEAGSVVELGDFESRALADAATSKVWDEGVADLSGLAPLYRLPDGREVVSSELPPGAVYHAEYMDEYRPGPDGKAICAVCPDGHHWLIDSRASNCTLPDDDVHRCWCRHGDARDGTLHVDKVGVTCQAGAGSIQTSKYHGKLENGSFTAG